MRRVLILGGTAWLGRELARQLIDDGVHVTCLARGTTGPPPAGATFVVADRSSPGAYDAVRATDWDEVMEISWDVQHVTDALSALAGQAAHWTLISSCSVYAANDQPGADETAELATPADPPDHDDYATAKVLCEEASAGSLGDRLLTVRAGLIVGPGDDSDRFGYWVSRLALASTEDVLVPDPTGRFVQVIERARLVAGNTGRLVGATPEWLLEQGVAYWAGPRSLPLWLPEDFTGFNQRSNALFRAAGGTLRDLTATLEDTLDDKRSRSLDRERRSGLTRSEELKLLSLLR